MHHDKTSSPKHNHFTYSQKRHHNPYRIIKRERKEKFLIGLGELAVLIGLYYYLSVELGGGFIEILFLINEPSYLRTFPLAFWIGIFSVMVLSKIFKRCVMLIGTLVGEIVVELFYFGKIHDLFYVIGFFIVLMILIISIKPYAGGEYYFGKKIPSQLLTALLPWIIFLPLAFIFVEFPDNVVNSFPDGGAHGYLALIMIVNGIFLIIPYWCCLFFLDRFLVPYFPLEEQEQKDLAKKYYANHSTHLQSDEEFVEMQIKDKNYQELDQLEIEDDSILIPQPGELYIQSLTHHPIHSDDHTIVVMVGKVKVYLCTRCTAMVFGVILSILYSKIINYDFGYTISEETAFWLVILLPIIPLIDWGLQAIHKRKATTKSRLITGFILGFNISLIMHTYRYQLYIILITAIYFVIFGVLMKIRAEKEKNMLDEYFLEYMADYEEKF